MSLVIEVKVIPNSKKQSFSLEQQGIIKCNIKSQPEKGKANEELIKLLSKTLAIPQQNFKILSGHTNRKKIIKINNNDITIGQIHKLCNLEPKPI